MQCLAVKRNQITKPLATPQIQVEGKSVPIDSVLLHTYSSKNLKSFYHDTGYRSVWQSKKARIIILEELFSSEQEGLNSSDYNGALLKKYEKKFSVLTDKEKAKYDILFTHAFQKYILHLTRGRLNPGYLYKNSDLKENAIYINETIAQLLKSDSLEIKISRLKPNRAANRSLKKALEIIDSYPVDDFLPIIFKNKIILNDTNPSLIDIKKEIDLLERYGLKRFVVCCL